MENILSRQEHEEFARRMDAENKRLAEEDRRQNHRIDELEENVKEIHKLTVSMERMSANMQGILEAIERQGSLIEKQIGRIDNIEKEPLIESRQIKMSIITTALSAVVAAVVGSVIALL